MADGSVCAVHAALRCHPEVVALVDGFAAKAGLAPGLLLFGLRQSQWRMLRAFEQHALASDAQAPERLVAAGAQHQLLEIVGTAAMPFVLQAIDTGQL